MSNDKQETSIADQRSAVTAYAKKNGFRIVKEFADHGISGDNTEQRHEFRRMLQEAAGGSFKAVLCWNSDRFGRFDLVEAGRWIHPLREAGVYLQTVTEGRIDWNDFAGRIVYAVQQEAKHGYLRDLSRNVSRGMLSAAQQGKVVWSRAPLGYRVEGGTYVPDEDTVDLLKRIFREYLGGQSTNDIARTLNREGIKAPLASQWNAGTILQILKRECYCGVYLWNTHRRAKYSEIRNGVVVPVDKRSGHKWRKSEVDLVRIENAHEPLISRRDWDRTQRLIAENAKNTTPRTNGGPFALRGLLKCGSCGGPMHGRRRDYGTKEVFYVCGNALHHPGKCWTNAVHQKDLIAEITRLGHEEVQRRFSDEAVEREIRATTKASSFPSTTVTLERRITTLDARIAKARARHAECARDMVEGLEQIIRGLLDDRSRAARELASATKPVSERVQEFRAKVDDVRKALSLLPKAAKALDSRQIRAMLSRLVEVAVVHVDRVRQGPKKSVSRFRSLEIRWKISAHLD